jgi:D-sedoheptulose 7-phosphate isomerase
MLDKIKGIIKSSIEVKREILYDDLFIENIHNIVIEIEKCFNLGGKVLFCGNGGSAADAQHLAAELSGRFYIDREPLFSEALHVNSSYVTAVSNDYGYDHVFSRLVKAMGRKNDILIGLSTSGNSGNIVNAFIKAKEIEMKTISFTGKKECKLDNLSDFMIKIPSSDTPRIQESHIMVGHIICELVEERIFV